MLENPILICSISGILSCQDWLSCTDRRWHLCTDTFSIRRTHGCHAITWTGDGLGKSLVPPAVSPISDFPSGCRTTRHFPQARCRPQPWAASSWKSWPPDAKNWLTKKDPDAGKDWRQEEKGTTEDEMVGWHHQLDGHEFEPSLGVGDGQGGLACCSPWGHKESNTTEQLNWPEFSEIHTHLLWKGSGPSTSGPEPEEHNKTTIETMPRGQWPAHLGLLYQRFADLWGSAFPKAKVGWKKRNW